MDIVWDGITRANTVKPEWAAVRQTLANAAKGSDWATVFGLLGKYPELANTTRPGGRSLYAPLHQAAYVGAAEDVVERLLSHGAWRTLQNGKGERPLDVAQRKGHHHLNPILEPRPKHLVPPGILLKVQHCFHAVIRQRANQFVEEHGLRLPELEPLLELEDPHMWFAVPGMYGGFSYRLKRTGVEPLLVAESWCRIVGGSGQKHEITSSGGKLVEEGFV